MRISCLQVVKDGLCAEKESSKCAEMKKIQAGDVSYEENSAAAASRARLEVGGVSAEKNQITATVCCYFDIDAIFKSSSIIFGGAEF